MSDTTDRELLEKAAKAAGIDGEYSSWMHMGFNDGIRPKEAGWQRHWNPLTDDGDALRLAVKLRMQVDVRNGMAWARTEDVIECAHVSPGQAGYEEDDFAATRRAIVRAAASMAGEKS